jgi:signal transduction histidine kinase/CheY-like chemotaxis protein
MFQKFFLISFLIITTQLLSTPLFPNASIQFRKTVEPFGTSTTYEQAPLNQGFGEYKITIPLLFEQLPQKPTLYFGPSPYPTVIKLNNKEIHRWGDGADSKFRANYRAVHVPLINTEPQNGENILTVSFWSDGEITALSPFYIDSRESVLKTIFIQNLFAVELANGIVFISLFVAFFFFAHFVIGKYKEWELFHIAMVAVTLSIGYAIFLFNHEQMPELFLFKISRVAFLFLPLFLLNFVRYFFAVWKHSRVFEYLPLILNFPIMILIILSDTKLEVNNYFDIASTYLIIPEILAIIIATSISIKLKSVLGGKTVLLGILLFAIASFRDIGMIARHITPEFWLTPYGYFLLLMATTIVIIRKQYRVKMQMYSYQEKLITANREVEKEVDVRENFIKSVAHELRTPLNGVLGTISGVDNPREINKNDFANIQFSFRRIQYALNNIFNYVAIHDKNIHISNHRFNLLGELEDMILHHRKLAEEKGVQLVFEIDIENFPKHVIGDSEKILQVCDNLLNNSVKFTSNGVIHCSTTYENGELCFNVKDDGGGVEEKYIKPLNDLFNSKTSQTYSELINLGFAISHSIVNTLSGSISFKNEEGVGVTFSVKIPLRKAESMSFQNWKGKKVLIVDDDIINQNVLKKVLKRNHLSVQTVNSGIEAIEIVRHNNFDIILMDIQMPLIDGYEATRLIHKIKPEIPVIAVTANGSYKRAIESGMCDLLQKPLNHDILLTTLLSKINSSN